jgi:hypothetical protein
MRSKFKVPGLALAALLGISLLTACGAQPAPSFNASDVDCADVTAELKTAQADLKAAEEELNDDDVVGTPAQVSVQDNIDTIEVKIDALMERSDECSDDPGIITAGDTECRTWEMQESEEFENDYWFEDGIIEIRTAVTPDDAIKASRVWLNRVRMEPEKLAGTIGYFLQEEVKASALVDSKGCATEKAADFVKELRMLFATSTITPDQASPDGYNSGYTEDTVTANDTPGVGGDRTAIKIVLPDGTVVWVMARCGNVVTPGLPPEVPHGKIQNENVEHNPDIDDVWKDGDEGDHKANADSYQGTLEDVAAEQERQRQAAEEERLRKEAEAEAARQAAEEEGAGTVEEDEDLPPAPPPPPSW